MIACTTMPPDKYIETLPDGKTYGLYQEYGGNPELFNLITRVATVPFMYEPGFEGIPLGKRIGRLNKEQCLVDSLEQKVEGIQLRILLRKIDPVAMYELFAEQEPDHLALVQLYNGWDRVLSVMELRVLQFRRHYRGVRKSNKGVITAQFRSGLSAREEESLSTAIVSLNKAFMGTM